MSTTTAPVNQSANFKTCDVAHFATATGFVSCGGRINGQFCEFDHLQQEVLDTVSDEEYDDIIKAHFNR